MRCWNKKLILNYYNKPLAPPTRNCRGLKCVMDSNTNNLSANPNTKLQKINLNSGVTHNPPPSYQEASTKPTTKDVRSWCRTNYGDKWYEVSPQEKKQRKQEAVKNLSGWHLRT